MGIVMKMSYFFVHNLLFVIKNVDIHWYANKQEAMRMNVLPCNKTNHFDFFVWFFVFFFSLFACSIVSFQDDFGTSYTFTPSTFSFKLSNLANRRECARATKINNNSLNVFVCAFPLVWIAIEYYFFFHYKLATIQNGEKIFFIKRFFLFFCHWCQNDSFLYGQFGIGFVDGVCMCVLFVRVHVIVVIRATKRHHRGSIQSD